VNDVYIKYYFQHARAHPDTHNIAKEDYCKSGHVLTKLIIAKEEILFQCDKSKFDF